MCNIKYMLRELEADCTTSRSYPVAGLDYGVDELSCYSLDLQFGTHSRVSLRNASPSLLIRTSLTFPQFLWSQSSVPDYRYTDISLDNQTF
jgi:hypothetical protein